MFFHISERFITTNTTTTTTVDPNKAKPQKIEKNWMNENRCIWSSSVEKWNEISNEIKLNDDDIGNDNGLNNVSMDATIVMDLI